MFGYEINDFLPWMFSKKPSNSFLENSIKDKLKGIKEVTKTFKQGDHTITEKSYTGDGFTYVETTSEYTPNEADLEIYKLQGELEKAVDNEDYTDAANIKSKIEQLKTTKKNEQQQDNKSDNNN